MKNKATLVFSLVLILVLAFPTIASGNQSSEVAFWLTILHNNDGESDILGSGDLGGVAEFKTVVDQLKAQARIGIRRRNGPPMASVMVSSGDNFLAGPEMNASLEKGIPFYDTIAMDYIGYDAVAIGNHDFDFGPDILADFIEGYDVHPPTYVSSNLDFSGEPRLQDLFDDGSIAKSVIVTKLNQEIGIIGAVTPNLPFISSPRNVEVDPDVAGAVQAEVDSLEAQGVEIIILISHLQNIDEDVELAQEVSGLDVIVAGGGDELLANPDDLLQPGDEGSVFGPYPIVAVDMDGREIPVVTTSGQYRYVGQLMVGFDSYGEIVMVNEARSGPVRVISGDCNGTLPCDDTTGADRNLLRMVTIPVADYVADLASTVIGFSEVDLDGIRENIRSIETNEGNLIADSFLWQATELAADFSVAEPDVAMGNGGGIRNDSIIPAGDITELDTFDMLPFSNFITVIEDLPRDQFKLVLENAVACTQPGDFGTNPNCGSGRFAQIGGFSYEYSSSGTGLILDLDGNVVVAGTRVQEAMLDDGTVIVTGGAVVPGDPVVLAIVDFLARGGDQYPLSDFEFTTLGVTYQQALSNYIQDGIAGLISAADYPEGGEGRIVNVP